MKVTVSLEPTLTQIEPGSEEGVYATFPDAQVDGATAVAGGADMPPDTVRLTGAPVATDTPADGLEPLTVPAGYRELGIPAITCGDRPASLRREVADFWLIPMMFGTTTECRGAGEVVQAEIPSPTHSTTAPSRLFNPGSYRRNLP
jgi:hypothetical protein